MKVHVFELHNDYRVRGFWLFSSRSKAHAKARQYFDTMESDEKERAVVTFDRMDKTAQVLVNGTICGWIQEMTVH